VQRRWDPGEFGRLLAAAIRQAGVTPQRFAQASGLSQSLISRWLNGKTRPSYDNLARLGAALAQRDPALAGAVPGLFAAAGYGSPPPAPPPLPDTVRENWDDPVVREIWDARAISEGARLGLVAHYLGERDAAGPGSGTAAGDAP
jgi:transcriptional regulator with XRE-family HTH domain